MRITKLFAVCALTIATNATATSWMGPRPILVSSPDTLIIVRIEVGDMAVRPFNYTDHQASTNSKAIYYRRDYPSESYQPYLEVILPHPVAPLEALVNNDGILVTLDNQESIGSGTVVAIFSAEGKPVKRYELSDIYTDEAIRELPAGIGLLYWRETPHDQGINSEHIRIRDKFANVLLFRLSDGSFSHRGSSPEKIRVGT